MKLRVVWGRRAANDLDAIAEFISKDSKAAARRVVQYIRKSAVILRESPRLGRASLDGKRELILSRYPYILVYEVSDDEVRILAVFHQSQDRP
jgi:addiction module RelE/StbE family toxin